MSVTFEWDPRKAKQNIKNHGVSFEEATTVFSDTFSSTIPDPRHSEYEERFVIIGESNKRRLLIVVHTARGDEIVLLVHASPPRTKGKSMKKANKTPRDPDMLDEYDFSNDIRGKYVKRLAAGSNIVVLSPDVAEVFPDSDSVNEALRALAKIVHKRARKLAA
jgi:hypothetical protein